MRTHYRNGDEISPTANGCDGCSPSMVNGVICHEQGCPDRWRDDERECKECGCEFYPDNSIQIFCDQSCMEHHYDYGLDPM